jgi:hypothetical protein
MGIALEQPGRDSLSRVSPGTGNRRRGARWQKSARAAPPPPQDFVLIRISNQAGKYATLGVKGDLLVAPKAQAADFQATEAPQRQLELERRGFKTKVEPV